MDTHTSQGIPEYTKDKEISLKAARRQKVAYFQRLDGGTYT